MPNTQRKPVIGITADINASKLQVGVGYAQMVAKAGGTPFVLTCEIDAVREYLQLCDGFVFTGGDDPIMTHWGVPMHPAAKPIDPRRQAFELAVLDALSNPAAAKPVLGVCLGMQLMGLHAGGKLDQHLFDTLESADAHWDRNGGREHPISGELGSGTVHSHHRQALNDPGRLQVVATSPDGVIEAVRAGDRQFYLGVQWHPERTADARLGLDLFADLVDACRAR